MASCTAAMFLRRQTDRSKSTRFVQGSIMLTTVGREKRFAKYATTADNYKLKIKWRRSKKIAKEVVGRWAQAQQLLSGCWLSGLSACRWMTSQRESKSRGLLNAIRRRKGREGKREQEQVTGPDRWRKSDGVMMSYATARGKSRKKRSRHTPAQDANVCRVNNSICSTIST